MRHCAREMLMRVPDSRSQVGAVSSPDRQRVVRRNFAGVETLLDLQRTHGNAFVQRLVQRKPAVRRGRDGYEQVADRVADAVVRRKDASISIPAIARSAEPGVQRMCTECEEEMQRGSPSITGVIARQPDPSPPPDPGWSDAPEKGLKGFNEVVTTVDEKGTIRTGKVESATSKGVWRAPVEGLSRGFQKDNKGPAFESPGGKAVALIPNTVNPTAPDKENNVPVDVLLHLHGYGVGYRELEPGKSESLRRRFEGRAVA